MAKILLFTLHFLGMMFFAVFQKSEVSVEQNVPEQMKPGSEVVVKVLIEKADVSGFAKFQIDVPQGLAIEPIETAGASFTFNEGSAKFIWLVLPSGKKFELQYRLVAAKDALGLFPVKSRFSYIYANERKNYDAPEYTVVVGDEDEIAANRIKESFTEPGDSSELTPAFAEVTRTISSAGINQWKVDLEIVKQGVSGFAKIEEVLPEGFTVIDLKSSSAVFSAEADRIKYIWYNMPANERVTVSYKLLPLIAMEGGEPAIAGNFSYLDGEETATVEITGDTGGGTEMMALLDSSTAVTPAESEALAAAPADVEPLIDTPSTAAAGSPLSLADTAQLVAESMDTEPPMEASAPASTTSSDGTNTPRVASTTPEPTPPSQTKQAPKAPIDANIVNVPEAETGIFYRVQIAAGHNNLSKEVFGKLYNFFEGFKLEPHEGWLKYTTGHHQVYKSARDDRERIRAAYDKFKGPFVTAYNDGARITVQEALMITDQKWYQ